MPCFAFADGRIQGRVSDASGEVYFEGAIIRIDLLNRETVTNSGGWYSFNNLPAGDHSMTASYLGAEEVSGKTKVIDDQLVIKDFRLGDSVRMMDNIIVVGQAAGINRAINQMRSADNLVSVITSDSIGQLPDENVSEALQRVSGVFIERDQGEGRYVGVRGIDSNLNLSTINGISIAAPESDRRSVALDILPSELVETLTVSKTLTPDMDAEAIGGSIDIKSLTAFDREGMFYSISANINYSDLEETNSQKYSGTFTNVFEIPIGELGVAFSYSNQERKFGSDNIETDGGWENDFEDDASNEFIAHEEIELRNQRITRDREGYALNLDWRVNNDTLIYSRYLYSLFGDQEFRDRYELKLDEGDLPVGNVSNTQLLANNTEVQRELRERFEQQQIKSLLFGFESRWGDWDIEGKLGFSEAFEREPNRIDSEFEYDNAQQAGYTSIGEIPNIFLSDDALNPDNYRLNEIEVQNNFSGDEHITASFDFKRDFEIAGYRTRIKFGGLIRDREKIRDNTTVFYEGDFIESFTWTDFIDDAVDYGLFSDFGPGINPTEVRNFTFNNIDQFDINTIDTQIDSANDYLINEEVTAAYIQARVDIGELRTTFGVRVEKTDIDAIGNNVVLIENEEDDSEVTDITPNRFSNDYTDILPSINMRYRVSEDLTLRASYYESIGRPSFGDIRPTHEDVELVIEDDNEAELVVESAGNPELEPFSAKNLDFSIEYYLDGIGVFSAGLFYKEIDNFIFTADIADRVNIEDFFDFSVLDLASLEVDEFVISLNGDKADIFGAEIAWSKAFLSGLILQANATFTDSSGDYPDRADEDLPLVNQSDLVANFIIGYEKDRFDLRLSSAYSSERLLELDDAFNDLYEDEHLQIDFSAKFNLNDSWQFFANAKNLTDEPFYTFHGNRSRNGEYEEYGTSFELGFTYRNQ